MIKLITLLFLTTITYNQKKEDKNNIYYDYNKKLQWSDFKITKQIKDASAETSTEISYIYEETNQQVSIKVFCSFDKTQSFVAQGKKTDYLLNHEQRHFDISHIFAGFLYKRLEMVNNINELKAKNIYDQIVIEWNNMQDQYDEETAHSINEKEQYNWDIKINQLLKNK